MAARELMEEHLITFMMAMRCYPDWDYTNTSQLTQEERALVLEFVKSEEGAVNSPEDETPFEDLPIKKP